MMVILIPFTCIRPASDPFFLEIKFIPSKLFPPRIPKRQLITDTILVRFDRHLHDESHLQVFVFVYS